MSKLTTAFHLFDAYNHQDPRVFTWEGVSKPQEYFFAVKPLAGIITVPA